MSQQTLSKADLVKRINYHELFQEIVAALPNIILEQAKQFTDAEVKSITDLNGNIMMISIALTRCIQTLYKSLPEYELVRNLNPSSYSTFLYNALQGLMAIDNRLLKSPLIRLFGDNILTQDNNIINQSHPLYAYIKVCGPDFIASCKKPLCSYWEDAIKNSFLSLLPYRTKNASYEFHQLIYLPIIKPSGTHQISKDKWQLYFLSAKHYCVPVSCTATRADDRYKIFYEDANSLIESAKSAVNQLKVSLKYRPQKEPDEYTGQLYDMKDINTDFIAVLGFKQVTIKGVDDTEVKAIYDCFTVIKSKLGKLAELVNKNTSLMITNVRKASFYERASNTLLVNVAPRYHDSKIAYVYAQALDRIIAAEFFKKKNHLGSDYWYLLKDDKNSPLERSLQHMYQYITFQYAPNYVYSAALLDGLYGKFFFLHSAELFARAIAKLIAKDTSLIRLSLPIEGSASLLYPNDQDTTVFELSVDSVEANLPVAIQSQLLL